MRSLRALAASAALAVVVTLGVASPADAAPGDLTHFPTTSSVVSPNHLVLGPDGNVWFTNGLGGPPLGRSTPAGVVTIVPTPGVTIADAIAVGDDGNVWFSAFLDDGGGGLLPAVARVEVGTEVVTTFTAGLSDLPQVLTPGPDGRLWFADTSGRLGRVAMDGTVETFAHRVPAGVEEEALSFDSSGNLWTATPAVPASAPAALVRTAGDGTQTTFPVDGTPGSVTVTADDVVWFGDDGSVGRRETDGTVIRTSRDALLDLRHLTVGGDGNVWFAARGSSRLGRVSGDGTVALFAHGSGAAAGPFVRADDGDLWYGAGDDVARLTPAGGIRTFGAAGVDGVVGLSRGPGSDLWFGASSRALGSITTAGEITVHTAPAHLPVPAEVVTGPDDNLWFTAARGGVTTDDVGEMTPTGDAQTYGGPPACRTARPCSTFTGGRDLTSDGVGRLWFLDTEPQIGRVDLDGDLSAWALGNQPVALTVGPTGTAWVTGGVGGPTGGRVWRVLPSGAMQAFRVPGVARTGDVVPGPDGNVWFAAGRDRIGRITPTGQVRTFGAPTVRGVTDLAPGDDGNVWFAAAGRVGRIRPDGAIRTFTHPGLRRAVSLTAGPGGDVWFATEANPRLGRVSPAGDIAFVFGGLSFTEGPPDLAVGGDGALWATSAGNDRLARATDAGALTTVATGFDVTGGLTAGPDGHLWFGVSGGLGRLELA